MEFKRMLSVEGVNPYESVEWVRKDIEVRDGKDCILFQCPNAEFPITWSPEARNVVAQKYFRISRRDNQRETSVKQMVDRVVNFIMAHGKDYFKDENSQNIYKDELTLILINQIAAFNSPVYFNVGVPGIDVPQASACFINSVEDSMESILELAKTEGLIFKEGSGSGVNFSTLRGSNEEIKGGGTASGPVSFMQGFDAFASTILSGGRLRRAARMCILNIDHPDIRKFINCKAQEEDIVQLLALGGMDPTFNATDSAYAHVRHQSGNNSVRITDKFMHRVQEIMHGYAGEDEGWELRNINNNTVAEITALKGLFESIAKAAHKCGDPGIQFHDTINKYNTCSNDAPIVASNPCLSGRMCLETDQGPVPIAELADTHFNLISPVTDQPVPSHAWCSGVKPLYAVKLIDKTVLECTEDHIFLLDDNAECPAKELFGKILKAYTGKYRPKGLNYPRRTEVISIEYLGEEKVYDFSEPTEHWGIANGIWVHNCSEYMFLNHTACNLSSINLDKFASEPNNFNTKLFKHVTRVMLTAQDILCSAASYPTEAIRINTQNYRPLGLGFTNLGGMLMSWGIPYDSDKGRCLASNITSLMTAQAYRVSAEMAEKLGAFDRYKENAEPMEDVLNRHYNSTKNLSMDTAGIKKTAVNIWKEVTQVSGTKKEKSAGFRNAQVTLTAPTGCLAGDTMVLSSMGLLPIKGMGTTTGKKWQSINTQIVQENASTPANKFYINGIEDTITITTKRGHEITSTKDHKFRVIDAEGDYVWRKASDIKKGDTITTRIGGHEELLENKSYVPLTPYASKHPNATILNLPTSLNEPTAEILGFYTGNGYTKIRGGLHLVICNKDKNIASYFDSWAKNIGIIPTIESRKGCFMWNAHSFCIAPWFKLNGVRKNKGNHGEGSASATIPPKILQSKTSVLCAFLRGLFTADGTVGVGKGGAPIIELSTTSKTLAKQTHAALEILGVSAYLSTFPKRASHWGDRTCYRVRISSTTGAAIFKTKIGFLPGRKQEKLITGLSKTWKEPDRTKTLRHSALIDDFYTHTKGLPNAIRQDIASRKYDKIFNLNWAARLTQAHPQLQESKINTLLNLGENIRFVPVKSVKKGKRQATYDISVPHNNTYVASSFVSHNTISLMLDCATFGAEPDIALRKQKHLVGGETVKFLNPNIVKALNSLGYDKDTISSIMDHVIEHGHLENSRLKEEHLSVFDCAFPIASRFLSADAHLKMVAAIQPFISGAISKTINLPEEADPEQIERIFLKAWELGLKCVTVYRKGSKLSEPMQVEKLKNKLKTTQKHTPTRERLPDTRESITHHFSIGGHDGYFTIGFYPDSRRIGELFIRMASQGSVVSGVLDAFATSISLNLQHGVPIEDLVGKFKPMNFTPNGVTRNRDIPLAKSIVSYIFSYIEKEYLKEKIEETKMPSVTPLELEPISLDGEVCPQCGNIMRLSGTCYTCENCTFSGGVCQ